jgi:phosphatidylglycerophosphate synthase
MRAGKDTFLFRIANVAYHCGFTPNIMTAFGLTFGIICGILFAIRVVPLAFTFGFASVFCDVLDGTLARKFHLETRFGLFFDSVSDRVTEAAVVIGALASGIIQPFGLVAIMGSVCLLLFRAYSYQQRIKTDFALFGRFERLIFILAGLLIPFASLSSVCFVIAGLFGLASSCHIAIYLWRSIRQKKKKVF